MYSSVLIIMDLIDDNKYLSYNSLSEFRKLKITFKDMLTLNQSTPLVLGWFLIKYMFNFFSVFFLYKYNHPRYLWNYRYNVFKHYIHQNVIANNAKANERWNKLRIKLRAIHIICGNKVEPTKKDTNENKRDIVKERKSDFLIEMNSINEEKIKNIRENFTSNNSSSSAYNSNSKIFKQVYNSTPNDNLYVENQIQIMITKKGISDKMKLLPLIERIPKKQSKIEKDENEDNEIEDII